MRFFLTLLCAVLCLNVFGQNSISWLATAPVAHKMYGNLHPRIKLDKYNNPMVVWGDDAGKAWFSKWGGESFSPPVVISQPGHEVFATSWAGPDIASRGDTVYVVYKELPEDKGHIYIKHSYDGGVNFSASVEVDTTPGSYISRFPTVSADEAGNAFVTFMKSDKGYDNQQYYVARSDDMGETFYKDTFASVVAGNRVCECSPAALVASGTAGILLYRNNLGGLRNIWASISTNGSRTFTNSLQMDSTEFYPSTCPASGPAGVIVGDTLYSVYMSGKNENAIIYLSKLSLSNPSLSVQPVTGAIPGVVMQNFPRISGVGYAAGVVWTQTSGGNNMVCLSITDDLTRGFPQVYDTVATGVMLNADVAIGGGFIYVVWEDQETHSVMYRRGVYYKKKKEVENTSMLISGQNVAQHYFTINMPDLISCAMTDATGHEFEMDISYPKSSGQCQVDTQDMEEGEYTIKAMDKDGRIYTARMHLKTMKKKGKDD
jgi:hypothetical protein